MKITELEIKIMTAILDGDDPILEILRNQYKTSTIINREFSGSGFFVYFSIPNENQKVKPGNFIIDDLFLDIEEVKTGAMCLLYVNGGHIDCLEVVSADDWPKSITLKKILYVKKEKRTKEVSELVPQEKRNIEDIKLAWNNKNT